MAIANADCGELAEALHHGGVTALASFAGIGNMGTSLEISVADDSTATLEQYERIYRAQPNPLGIPISFRKVEYPLSRLREVMADVDESRAVVEPFGAYVSVIGPGRSNRVEIALSRYSEEAADALYALFGDMIIVNTQSRTVTPAPDRMRR